MFETKDVLLYESGNGGEIAIINNDIALNQQLFQQVYLKLFGGNIEADTKGNELPSEIRSDWWGNSLQFSDRKPKQFNSETERSLNNNVLNSSGRINIQRAVENDLRYFKDIADIKVSVIINNYDSVLILIELQQPGNQRESRFQLSWDNAKKQLITDKTI